MTPFFVTGGTMKPDAASYVPREADEQLYNAVLAGEYCNVLTTRQMGKSSLMARTAARLRLQGVACATVDLQGKGDEISAPEQWYYGVTKQISTGLELSFDLSDWWRGQSLLLPAQRMTDFFADVVLKQIAGPVVVFIDEVDWMIRLKFSDEFFAAVRSCFNRRATEPAFNRLTFVLLGSAAPAQLIRDATRTPFNVGRGIELTDFTPKEAGTLAGALGGDGETILSRILYWTDGHPYLTQMLCAKVLERERNGQQPEECVDSVVQDNLLAASARQEENNLKFVADRLTQGTRDLRGVLRVYRDVLRGKAVKDVPASAIHTSLRLSGVVKPDAERRLRIRNLVYRRVFCETWVREKMPPNVIAIAGAAALLVIGGFLGWYLLLYPRPYVAQLEAASKDVPYDAYAALQRPFLRARADDLFAQFWERRGDRDTAILVRARGADQGDERKRLASLIGADYPSLVTTMRHDASVYAVTFCPPGDTVLTVANDKTARVFEAATGREISRIVLPHFTISRVFRSAALTPDCKVIALRSEDYQARLFDAATGREISHLVEAGPVLGVALSADARLVATASGFGGSVRVFVAATGREVSRVASQHIVHIFTLSPDGKMLATASLDHIVRVFLAATGREIYRINLQVGNFALAFSPDGKLLAAGSNYSIRVFEAATGRDISRLNSSKVTTELAFSRNGKLIAAGSLDDTVRVFEAATGREISRVAQRGTVSAVSFNPDGKLVAIGSADKTTRVFEAATGRGGSRLAQQGAGGVMAFSPNGRLVATDTEDKTVEVFEAATGREVSRLARHDAADILRFSPDDKLVATAYEDKTAWVFEVATGRVVSRLAQQGAVMRLAFSPDSKLVATSSEDKKVQVFEAATGRAVSHLAQQGMVNIVLAFSPDSHLIATDSRDEKGLVFEVATGRAVSRLAHQGSATVVTFGPDSKLVAIGSNDKTARVLEAATGREVSRLAQQDVVNVLTFSPDGKQVATGSDDNTVRVFEAGTGREVSRLAQQSEVNVVAFSPDGTLLVTQAGNWLNLYRRENDRWRPLGVRHLPVIWPQTVRFLPKEDRCPHCVEVVRDTPENMFKLERINFDEYSDPPIRGDPAHLLAEWSAKLGLTFDARGRIVPLQH